MATVTESAGLRANRIEALLSARLFVEPQLAADRLYFISNLSGHLSLYRMDVSGGVPEPLLPPGIALQNPELAGGHLFFVLPALDRIVVMVDRDGDENYEPCVIPIEGGFPEPLVPEAFAGRRSHLLDVVLPTSTAYFSVESREESIRSGVRLDLANGVVEELHSSRYGAFPMAWAPDGSRVVLADGYTAGDTVLYELDEGGERRMLHGTPIEEREPDEEYPLSGFRESHVASSGAGMLVGTALFDDGGAPAYLDFERPGDLEPVTVEGLAHEGAGELESIRHLEGDRFALIYNIDGCSWAYETRLDEPKRRLRVERVLVGNGALEGGILHGLHFDEESGRYVLSYCTATDPTQIWVLEADDAQEPARKTRERVLGVAPGLLSVGEDASFESHDGLRVSARLYLPSAETRARGPAAARVLRPRRSAEPGAAQLRLVLDAAHPGPHPRGLCRVRAERPRIVGLRARVHEARRPRLGRAGPARPRPRDDRGAPA